MKQTSLLNPPSTDYRRPVSRKFYMWRDRHIYYGQFGLNRGWEERPWRWCCTLCDPPAYGFRARSGAFRSIMTVSMPNHFRRRHFHHQHVARTSGR